MQAKRNPLLQAAPLCRSTRAREVLPPSGLADQLPQRIFADDTWVNSEEDFSGKILSRASGSQIAESRLRSL
jgi:hypothetical protein